MGFWKPCRSVNVGEREREREREPESQSAKGMGKEITQFLNKPDAMRVHTMSYRPKFHFFHWFPVCSKQLSTYLVYDIIDSTGYQNFKLHVRTIDIVM